MKSLWKNLTLPVDVIQVEGYRSNWYLSFPLGIVVLVALLIMINILIWSVVGIVSGIGFFL